MTKKNNTEKKLSVSFGAWCVETRKSWSRKKVFFLLFFFNLAGLLLELIVRCRGWCCVCYFIEHIINIISIILWSFLLLKKVFVLYFLHFSPLVTVLRFFFIFFFFKNQPKHLLVFLAFTLSNRSFNRENIILSWKHCVHAAWKCFFIFPPPSHPHKGAFWQCNACSPSYVLSLQKRVLAIFMKCSTKSTSNGESPTHCRTQRNMSQFQIEF